MNLESRWNMFTGHPDYWSAIEKAYTAKGRYYHSLKHIEFCLEQLDNALGRIHIDNPEAVEMAIWFHDIVYDATATDGTNELNSAFMASDFITELMPELSEKFRYTVYTLILATKHDGEAKTNDEQVMCDIDLAALGVNASTFAYNQDLIRKEYAHLSDHEFYKGSVNLLLGFLARDFIYYNKERFRYFYEANARNNIKNRINYVVNNYF